MIKNTNAITASSYLGMFFLGVSASLIGAAARNIGLSPYHIGLMLTMQNIGFMISVMISGAMADTYEKPKILFVGSLILAASFFAFYLTGLFLLNLLIMLLIGVGVGTYEGVTDAMLLDIHSKRESLHININHFFVTFGSIIITLYLIILQMNWRSAVTQSAIIVLLLSVMFALSRLAVRKRQTEPYLKRLQILRRDKVVVALFIATALAVGIEGGTIGILTTYLMDLRSYTQITSKIGLLVFLGGVASGRLFVGFFSRKEQITRYILGLFGLSVLLFSGLYFLDIQTFTYIPIYLAGIAISALLPLMLTLAGLLYKDMSGTVLGVIKVAIPIGGILLPFLLSLIAKYISFQASLIIFPLASLIAFSLLFVQIRSIKSFAPVSEGEAAD